VPLRGQPRNREAASRQRLDGHGNRPDQLEGALAANTFTPAAAAAARDSARALSVATGFLRPSWKRPEVRMLRTVAVALSLFAASAPSLAQELLAVDFAGNAFGVDVDTGASRTLGPTGLTACNAMAVRNGVLYVTCKSGSLHQLAVLDPIDYQPAIVIPNLGVDVRGLCAGIAPNELFAVVNNPNNSDSLYRIDVQTGSVQLIGPTGRSSIQALTMNGRLRAWDLIAGLLDIDKTTGAATDPFPAISAMGADIQFLAMHGGITLGGRSQLYRVDVATGVPTLLGAGGYSDLRGAEDHRGRVTKFGQSCQPQVFLTGASAAMPSANVICTTAQHEPNALGVLYIGFQQVTAPIPGSTCSLLVSNDQQMLVPMNQSGVQKFTLPLPPTFGVTLNLQLVTPASVPGGVLVTNAICVEVPN
jgi:hypothetical protein